VTDKLPARTLYRLTPKSCDRCDVEPLDGVLLLHTDADVVRLTPEEARSLGVILTHGAAESERLTPA
jgi:hypothetical protein